MLTSRTGLAQNSTLPLLLRPFLRHLAEEEIGWLFWPSRHMTLLSSRRAEVILTRIRLVALLFAVLTTAWIAIDMIVLPWPIWGLLAIGRLTAGIAFALTASKLTRRATLSATYTALAALYAIPTLFFIYSYWVIQGAQLDSLASTLAGIYAFLPIIMVAGLGMFPLTAIESIMFALPVILIELLSSLFDWHMLSLSQMISSVWLAVMIAVVASLCGISQLGFMIALVRQAVRDPLTHCFSRLSGEELLEIQFILASRSNTPLSIAFVDLDNFKSINDNFGHEAGDHVLRSATQKLRSILRTGDMLVRWGGEEFVLILPSTYCPEAAGVLQRVLENGLGERPDGMHMTASIGLAERTLDSPGDWRKLIEIADQRMYAAKHSGKNRIVACA